MSANYILGALAIVFLGLGIVRMASGDMKAHPQIRTWLIIGGIFALVSAWLFYQG